MWERRGGCTLIRRWQRERAERVRPGVRDLTQIRAEDVVAVESIGGIEKQPRIAKKSKISAVAATWLDDNGEVSSRESREE